MSPDTNPEQGTKEETKRVVAEFSSATQSLLQDPHLRDQVTTYLTERIRGDFEDPQAKASFSQTGDKWTGNVLLGSQENIPLSYDTNDLINGTGEIEAYPTNLLVRAVDKVISDMDHLDVVPLDQARKVSGLLTAFGEVAKMDPEAAKFLKMREGKFKRFNRDTNTLQKLEESTKQSVEPVTEKKNIPEGETMSRERAADIIREYVESIDQTTGVDSARIKGIASKLEEIKEGLGVELEHVTKTLASARRRLLSEDAFGTGLTDLAVFLKKLRDGENPDINTLPPDIRIVLGRLQPPQSQPESAPIDSMYVQEAGMTNKAAAYEITERVANPRSFLDEKEAEDFVSKADKVYGIGIGSRLLAEHNRQLALVGTSQRPS